MLENILYALLILSTLLFIGVGALSFALIVRLWRLVDRVSITAIEALEGD